MQSPPLDAGGARPGRGELRRTLSEMPLADGHRLRRAWSTATLATSSAPAADQPGHRPMISRRISFAPLPSAPLPSSAYAATPSAEAPPPKRGKLARLFGRLASGSAGVGHRRRASSVSATPSPLPSPSPSILCTPSADWLSPAASSASSFFVDRSPSRSASNSVSSHASCSASCSASYSASCAVDKVLPEPRACAGDSPALSTASSEASLALPATLPPLEALPERPPQLPLALDGLAPIEVRFERRALDDDDFFGLAAVDSPRSSRASSECSAPEMTRLPLPRLSVGLALSGGDELAALLREILAGEPTPAAPLALVPPADVAVARRPTMRCSDAPLSAAARRARPPSELSAGAPLLVVESPLRRLSIVSGLDADIASWLSSPSASPSKSLRTQAHSADASPTKVLAAPRRPSTAASLRASSRIPVPCVARPLAKSPRSRPSRLPLATARLPALSPPSRLPRPQSRNDRRPSLGTPSMTRRPASRSPQMLSDDDLEASRDSSDASSIQTPQSCSVFGPVSPPPPDKLGVLAFPAPPSHLGRGLETLHSWAADWSPSVQPDLDWLDAA